ncbi:MAG: Gfo/Idh/MocA family oxidoreductase [Chthonomonadales bacterium]|nr:Gfo/Idh/MocA family oxidoreductase [Chthonomonadales bacterium]
MSAEIVRWGVLGPGSIARAFATGLRSASGARLEAVASRTRERADAFGEQFGVPRRHVGYEALADDPEVDIVYIATPHPFHYENMLLCLERGKPVVCEKPFTINAAQADTVIRTARERGLFAMEGMWTRFFPLMGRLREVFAGGAIGEGVLLQADFGFRGGFDPRGRLFDPALGGGSLLDVGVYPVSLASMLFGRPDRVTGLACMGVTGVDEVAAIALGYPGDRLALLASAVRANTAQDASLTGTEGRVRVESPWWRPSAMTLWSGDEERRIEEPFAGNGFNYEAEEAMRCLREGRTESAVLPLEETLAVMRTMDALRAGWGLRYPGE